MQNEKYAGSKPIVIPDNHFYDLNNFFIQNKYKKFIKGVMIPGGFVRDRVEKMAYDINNYYKEGEIHLICLLKGARVFFDALTEYMNKQESELEVFPHFVQMNTYKNAAASGEVKFIADELIYLKGKDVLVVDDIIESGNTFNFIKEWLNRFNPKTISLAALIQVRREGKRPEIDFLGFTCPKEWFVGFGVDYNERFRGINHICVLNEEAKSVFAE